MLAILGNLVASVLEFLFMRWTRPKAPETIAQVQAENEAKPDTDWHTTVDKL